jgi:hypothetical protein
MSPLLPGSRQHLGIFHRDGVELAAQVTDLIDQRPAEEGPQVLDVAGVAHPRDRVEGLLQRVLCEVTTAGPP